MLRQYIRASHEGKVIDMAARKKEVNTENTDKANKNVTDVTDTDENKRSVDEMLDELAETVEKLDDEDISLEEAFKLYERGMKLAKACNEGIDLVEKKVMALTAEGEEEFE